MTFQDLLSQARAVRQQYQQLEKAKYGRSWTGAELTQGLVGDVGDLMKLVMAKEGIRQAENVDTKLAHELADCLWSVMVIADAYQVDLEAAFSQTMSDLQEKITSQINSPQG